MAFRERIRRQQKKVRPFMFVLALAVGTASTAAEDLERARSLEEYFALAERVSPELRAAEARFRAAMERPVQARALPDPALELSIGGIGAGGGEYMLGVSQALPWPGTRGLRGEIAETEAEAARQRMEAVRLRVLRRVSEAYWEYWFLGRQLDVSRESLALLTYLEEVARARYMAGALTQDAVIRMQVELGRLEDSLRSIEDLMMPASTALATAAGIEPPAVLPVPRQAPPRLPDAIDYAAALETLKARSPEVLAAEVAVFRGERAVELARRQGRPDFMAGLGYSFGSDMGGGSAAVTFGMRMPLGRERYRAAEREQSAARSAAKAERDALVNDLAAELARAVNSLRDALRRVDFYTNSLLPKARQSLEVTRQSFELGRAGVLDLVDSQRTLLEIELSLARSRADAALADVSIMAMTGGEGASSTFRLQRNSTGEDAGKDIR